MTCATGPMCQHQADCLDYNCPGRTDRLPQSCESLGICQHPERECPGACEQVPRLPEFDPEATELFHRISYWTNVLLICLGALAILGGFVIYLWMR